MGLPRGPSGVHGLEEDMGSRRKISVVCGPGVCAGGPSSLSVCCLPGEQCHAEEVCVMSWYTPMPLKNGSVVMRVDVSSNSLGPFIPNKRCPSQAWGEG